MEHHTNGFTLKLDRYVPTNVQTITQLDVDASSSDIQMDIQNYANVQYLADVCFGNPPQMYKASFDTGSSNTWILKNYTDSSTLVQTNQTAEVYFGSGMIKGRFYTDEVRFGENCLNLSNQNINNTIDLKKQKFGMAQSIRGFGKDVHFNAIIGMAYPELAQKNVSTVFENIMSQKKLSHNLFSFYVTNDMEEKIGGLQSEISFGFYDKKKFQGELKWHPVIFKYMFGIKLDDVRMNGKSIGLGCDKRECLVTIDSGTSHLAFPEWAMDVVKGKVPIRNIPVPCTKSEDFGDLSFIMNGIEYKVPNMDWTFEAEKYKNSEKMGCRAAIRQRDLRKEMFVLGDIFMRQFYTVFDRDNDRVGLAQKKTLEEGQMKKK